MPDFGAISDLLGNVGDAFGFISDFAGSLASPFGELADNELLSDSLGGAAAAE
jgi:hypothetical protein